MAEIFMKDRVMHFLIDLMDVKIAESKFCTWRTGYGLSRTATEP